MQTSLKTALTLLVMLWGTTGAQAGIALVDFGINVDGTTYTKFDDGLGDLSSVPGIDDSGFDYSTGLGTLSISLGGAGSHNVDLFLDHEIDEAINTFFNEFGTKNGAAAAGQSWEIDEPGFVFGDIYVNFLLNTFDNANGVPASSPDDVSMGLGWDLSLAAGETAFIEFVVDDESPVGFFLSQTDPDSNETIYFSSTLNISSDSNVVPEPTSLAIFGLMGLTTLGVRRRRRREKNQTATA